MWSSTAVGAGGTRGFCPGPCPGRAGGRSARPGAAGEEVVRLAGTRPERDGDRLRVAVALDRQLDLVAGLVRGDRGAELVPVADFVAVELRDDVAGLEARVGGRRAAAHLAD